MDKNYLRFYFFHNQQVWNNVLPAAEFSSNSFVTEDLVVLEFELYLR